MTEINLGLVFADCNNQPMDDFYYDEDDDYNPEEKTDDSDDSNYKYEAEKDTPEMMIIMRLTQHMKENQIMKTMMMIPRKRTCRKALKMTTMMIIGSLTQRNWLMIPGPWILVS